MTIERATGDFQPAVQNSLDRRNAASLSQQRGPSVDMGGRRAVTSGGHLDGFLDVIESIIIENHLTSILDKERRPCPGVTRILSTRGGMEPGNLRITGW